MQIVITGPGGHRQIIHDVDSISVGNRTFVFNHADGSQAGNAEIADVARLQLLAEK